MATYRNLKELGNNTLKEEDVVILKEIEYTVYNDFLSTESDNSKIFKILGLDPKKFCTEHYGYEAYCGIWPQCKNEDYSALTRVVKALFEIIEKDLLPFKIGDTVKVKSFEYACSINKRACLKREHFGGVHEITDIDTDGNCKLDNGFWYFSEVLEPYQGPEFKVGDTVRVKSSDWYHANKDEYGNISFKKGATFIASMAQYCNKITTIKKIDHDGDYILEDCNIYCFSPEAIEKVIPDIAIPIQYYDEIALPEFSLKYHQRFIKEHEELFLSSNKVECSSEFKFTVNKPKKVFF